MKPIIGGTKMYKKLSEFNVGETGIVRTVSGAGCSTWD